MATRTVYIPNLNKVGVIKKDIEFKWHAGFAPSQKQKSIVSLHEEANKKGIAPILEISSKSLEDAGIKASAFNLFLDPEDPEKRLCVESAFQGSKVFRRAGPFPDIYKMTARDAKKTIRERAENAGELTGFDFQGEPFPREPKTFFYDWIYINALSADEWLSEKIEQYKGFTDIEFNPQKSINCQAYSAAAYVSLVKNNLLKEALDSKEAFKDILETAYKPRLKTGQPAFDLKRE